MSSTYDIIFAGGGATACITASRLAEADPKLNVLILEAGPDSQELHYHVQPGRYFGNLLVPREIFSFHFGKGGKGTNERMHLIPAGRALGGGSSINFAMYNRPAPSDFDDWETMYGNKGWGSKELIPLMNKAETYQPNPNHPNHGSSGPLKISIASDYKNLADDVIKVGVAIDKDHKEVDDVNAFDDKAVNNWAPMQRYIDGTTGRRSDTAHHYIYNKNLKNLTVKTRAKVTRVIFEGTRAVGVEYVNDVVGRAKGVVEPTIIKASRLVVLSAGSFGSPAILERSGVGSAEVLKKNGITQLVDLPGVGENYQDHNLVIPSYYGTDDTETMDDAFRGTEEEQKEYTELWLKEGKGAFANNGINATIKLRPTEADLKTMSPSFDARWKSYYADKPDKWVLIMAPLAAYYGLNPAVPRGKYFSIAYYSAYPIAKGSLHITSATDAYSAMDFNPGFLEDFADVITLRWGYKKAREIARRSKFFKGYLAEHHPTFPEGSEADVSRDKSPVPIDAPFIKYTEADDEAIDAFHRQTAETCWHSLGTCSMKPRQEGGVVDSHLNVYGTTNLKVADLSIAPGNVGANTYSTVIAIGEKAAVVIAKELGINGLE
ncbi:hypothetical protein D9613_005759 [Agrocybe pediades]|uniref:pyranose dehydrogenase (acceptor) n=1 Tax=Agrocybe pediades TaxID=84607 RepID=A0A8H4QV93_9AGAR|nr:hypothetical protein D9613_005759 [Agrocybe pediades]